MEKLGKYPHMKPEDVAVWERFLEKQPVTFETLDYDYPVGKGQAIPVGTAENIAADMKILSQRKIDVVGYRDNEIWIIEVKPEADMRALGQLIVYQELFVDTERADRITIKAVVCGGIGNDLLQAYASQGIRVFIV